MVGFGRGACQLACDISMVTTLCKGKVCGAGVVATLSVETIFIAILVLARQTRKRVHSLDYWCDAVRHCECRERPRELGR